MIVLSAWAALQKFKGHFFVVVGGGKGLGKSCFLGFWWRRGGFGSAKLAPLVCFGGGKGGSCCFCCFLGGKGGFVMVFGMFLLIVGSLVVWRRWAKKVRYV